MPFPALRQSADDIIQSSCLWACGAVGSALPWHGRGQGFESLQVHQFSQSKQASPLREPEQKVSRTICPASRRSMRQLAVETGFLIDTRAVIGVHQEVLNLPYQR